MFIQDLQSRIVPFWARRGDDRKFEAQISGAEVDKHRAIELLSSLERGNSRPGLEELLCNVLVEVARSLSWYGRALYEICRSSEDNSFYLNGFTPARAFDLGLFWVQVIPRGDRDLWQKSVVILPHRDVWSVRMPKLLGGYHGHRAILRNLDIFGNSGPRFWRDDLERGQPVPTYFDFVEYRREVEIFVSNVTKTWGWNRRDLTDRYWTEFARFYRTMTFYWAEAVLREHIISEINLLLRRLGIDARLNVGGLPTPDEILRARGQMVEGKLSFGKAFEAVAATAG
jgi:hypothetical protein